jgi:Mitochondrial carrier protein
MTWLAFQRGLRIVFLITTHPYLHLNFQMSRKELGASDVTRRMICGGLAGMIAKTATNPLERIKMLSQTGEHGAKKGTIVSIYRNILNTEGIIGLWAGNGANLLRVFPSKAVVFSSHDVSRKWLTDIGVVFGRRNGRNDGYGLNLSVGSSTWKNIW